MYRILFTPVPIYLSICLGKLMMEGVEHPEGRFKR